MAHHVLRACAMSIETLMIRDVHTVKPTDSLNRAAQLMWEHDIGALPVLDPEGGVVGIITDRDVCMAAYTRGGALSDHPVSVAMATEVLPTPGGPTRHKMVLGGVPPRSEATARYSIIRSLTFLRP